MEEVVRRILDGEVEIEVDDIDALRRELERIGVTIYLVKYEEAYKNPFLCTIASLLDEHMAKCAVEFARARGASLHLIRAPSGPYLLLIPLQFFPRPPLRIHKRCTLLRTRWIRT